MRTILSITLMLAITVGATPSFAQNVRPVAGDRVRVRLAGQSATQVFTLQDVVADTLVLQGRAGVSIATVRMPLASISRLQVSAGYRSPGKRALRGAVRGFGGGFLAGGIMGLASGDDPEGWFAMTAEEKAVMGAVLIGTGGLLVGALVGLGSTSEKWESVPLTQISMSRTVEGGLAFGYTHRF